MFTKTAPNHSNKNSQNTTQWRKERETIVDQLISQMNNRKITKK